MVVSSLADLEQPRHFNVIVVGAGTSGSALAARLTEDAERTVLVLEAGEVFASQSAIPEEVRLATRMSATLPGNPRNWGLLGELSPGISYPIPRGKLAGGSSSINGANFVRGTPQDFTNWAERGNPEWAWSKVLPFFKRLEADQDFGGEMHGTDGPIPVRREQPERFRPVSQAFLQACLDLGFPMEADKNAGGSPGVGAIPLNAINGVRVGTAIGYLIPNLARDNLVVSGGAFVNRLLFDGTRATGVEVRQDGSTYTVIADEIVLCAGAVHSPHLLMLSGIGPADELRKFGLPVVLDQPAVGRDFFDHPHLYLYYQPRPGFEHVLDGPLTEVSLNHTASGSDIVGDLELCAGVTTFRTQMFGPPRGWLPGSAYLDLARRPRRFLRAMRGASVRKALDDVRHQSEMKFFASLLQENSRGQLSLRSADPTVAPRLEYRYLTEASDRERCRENIRVAVDIAESPAMRKIVRRRTSPNTEDLRSDASLDRWMLEKMGTSIHTSGTCKMGPAGDPGAVVDQYCRVHGITGLRVVDTSIMPTMVRRGPAASAVMLGERVAEFFGR
jgi:choline dehydrogenase-like flavoprotein